MAKKTVKKEPKEPKVRQKTVVMFTHLKDPGEGSKLFEQAKTIVALVKKHGPIDRQDLLVKMKHEIKYLLVPKKLAKQCGQCKFQKNQEQF